MLYQEYQGQVSVLIGSNSKNREVCSGLYWKQQTKKILEDIFNQNIPYGLIGSIKF